MNKSIPFAKLSKKEQARINASRRNSWGNTNPVTRRVESARAYNRAKAKAQNYDA